MEKMIKYLDRLFLSRDIYLDMFEHIFIPQLDKDGLHTKVREFLNNHRISHRIGKLVMQGQF